MRKMVQRVLGLTIAVWAVAAMPAQALNDHAPATALIEDTMTQNHIPAMAVAVVEGDSVAWDAAFGQVDIENNVPATSATLFRTGSVAKVFTATLAARLAQQGLIDLDRPISEYLSEWPENHPPISLRQLLGHLGGIRHYGRNDFNFEAPGGPIDFRIYPNTASILALFAADDLVAAPGETYHYSTFGYTLAGLVMEAATGQTFPQLLSDHLLNPAGIGDVRIDNSFLLIENRAGFYDPSARYAPALPGDAGPIVNAPMLNSAYKIPGGGLIATASAMARFGALHYGPGFVDAAHFAALMTPQNNAAGESTGVGLGWRIGQDDAGRTIYHHSGTQQGSRAHVVVYPEQRLSVAVMTNLGGMPQDIAGFAAQIAEHWLD